jgi:succinylarginine dihydrolase
MLIDLQLEGLPGPTCFHGGLSPGNLASQANAGALAHPRASARACIAKMRLALELGQRVALLPPLPRPDLELLRSLGFAGTDAEVVDRAGREEPQLLRLAASSASMWAANCATVIPASDSGDGRCHLVAANLVAMPHRALEAMPRARMLRRVFPDGERFAVHDPLPAVAALGDEGAANHHRAEGARGACHLFVHGRAGDTPVDALPRRHAARQRREASAAVARLGGLARSVHARQHPEAIDAGVFHNDVAMVGLGSRVLIHERALVDQQAALVALEAACGPLRVATIAASELALEEAVRSYLFNSVLYDTPSGAVLVAPSECAGGTARRIVDRLRADGFIARAEFIELSESMMGGGGPACLRLRVPLGEADLAGMDRAYCIDRARLDALERWVDARYRRELAINELRDQELLRESQVALDELTRLLGTGPLYRFQGGPV